VSITKHLADAPPALRRSVIALLLALSVAAAWAAVTYSIADPALAAWWPAAGLSVLAGMLARGRERWLVILLVVLATGAGNLLAGRDPLLAVLLGVGNTVEVVIIAALLAPRGKPLRLASLTAAARFIGIVLLGAVGSGVALGTVAAIFLGRPWVEAVGQLTASHAAATLVMLPVMLVPLREGRPVRRAELLLQSTVLAALIGLIFWPGNDWPVAFVPLVAFLWAALRFSLIITAVQLLLTALAVIVLTTLGGGPFVDVDPESRTPVVLIQIFLLVYAVSALLTVGARTDWFVLIRRLEAQEEALRQGIGTAEVGIVILETIDGERRVVAQNARARRALGRELPPFGVDALDVLVASSESGRVEFERAGHAFEASVAVRRDLGGAELVSIVIVDVTEREERERQAVALAEELRLLNAQKDDFISAVSHELRTPVTSIIGFSELLDDDRLPADLAETGTIIARNARRLADVIEDVLELSHLSALGGPLPDAVEVDVVRLARECATDSTGVALGRGVRVEVAPDAPDSLVIWSRERDLVRVCTNLLSNAIKFSHDAATVTIEIRAVDEGEGDGEVGGAIVRVVDRGLGIPPEHREMVWQRFARAPVDEHRRVPGTGLGLPIVRALLATRLGGSAELLETPGGGTTVEVRLPAVAPAISSAQSVE
jgi:signal transduction histidine kinase